MAEEKTVKKTNSYKTLLINTITFALGSLGSKLLVLILVPLYTSALSPDEYGKVDLIAQTANILIPLFTLAISEAGFRFSAETEGGEHWKRIYTVCLRIMSTGLLIMTVIFPLISRLDYINGFSIILYIYIWTSSFRAVNMNFVRAMGKIKLHSIDGIICTLTMLLLNILFLLKFKWGIVGYLLAIIVSDFISGMFLFIAGRLWKYIALERSDKDLAKKMIKYAAPMMPSTILWIITSVSDHFFVKYFHGDYANGILVVAYKIPMILTALSTIFSNAWNLSAVKESKSDGINDFFTTVFDLFQSFMYVLSAGVLLFIKPITYLWVEHSYFISYKYAPILTVATIFTCLNVFLGSVYSVKYRTDHTLYTSLAAGSINVVLNFALIPRFGIYGAAIATFISYFAVFFYRLYDTKKYINYNFSLAKILINTLLLVCMIVLNQLEAQWYIVYSAMTVLFAVVVVLNFKALLRCAVFILPQRIKSKWSFLSKIEEKLANKN